MYLSEVLLEHNWKKIIVFMLLCLCFSQNFIYSIKSYLKYPYILYYLQCQYTHENLIMLKLFMSFTARLHEIKLV